jgi:hypothetical protein
MARRPISERKRALARRATTLANEHTGIGGREKKSKPKPITLPETWSLHPCFICGLISESPDKRPPWRCHDCYNAVAANAVDGEL